MPGRRRQSRASRASEERDENITGPGRGGAFVVLRRGSNQRKTTRKPREARRDESVSGSGYSASSSSSSSRDSAKKAPANRNLNRKNGKSGSGQRKSGSNGSSSAYVLYVEGPRDREILACWARRIDHDLARAIESHAVILGGRRPARALSDFRKRGGAKAGLTGLVVLDRDDHSAQTHEIDQRAISEESGLEVFVWGRRHIESYLLVPEALRRLVGLDAEDRRIERFVEDEEHGPEVLHAKRILGTGGSLAEVVGTELRAGEIARAMRREEFHQDIFDLFDRIGGAIGLSSRGPEVVVRVRSSP
jgi:hypothetical protein